jgi:hypothetical protein
MRLLPIVSIKDGKTFCFIKEHTTVIAQALLCIYIFETDLQPRIP